MTELHNGLLGEVKQDREALAFTRMFSPYEFNPFDYNPLKQALVNLIDFEKVRRQRRNAEAKPEGQPIHALTGAGSQRHGEIDRRGEEQAGRKRRRQLRDEIIARAGGNRGGQPLASRA